MENDEFTYSNKILETVIDSIYDKQKPFPFKKEELKIVKLTSGLTNYLYVLTFPNEEKIFVKIFGKISQLQLVDRKFENRLIQINSNSGLCPSIIQSDDETYRIEEFIDDVEKPEDDHLFDEKFLKEVIHVATQFEISFIHINRKYLQCLMQEKTIFKFLDKIITLAKEKFMSFENSEKVLDKEIFEKLNKVKYYVNNYEEIFQNLTDGIKSLPYILNHCDVHKHNLLIKKDIHKLMLIDYEYACFNFIGFDFVNYFIESFFDLEHPTYPFYKLKANNVAILFEDEKFFKMYLNYIDELENKIKNIIEDDSENITRENDEENYVKRILSQYEFKILREKSYYTKIAAISSLFWFYAALITIESDKLGNDKHFDFLGYSIDRVSIYEHAIKLLHIN